MNGTGADACTIAIKDLGGDGTKKDNISVVINNCSFTGYPWGIQIFNGGNSSVTNCTFDCGSYDISVGEVYLDNWESIDFDDKRKAADGLISTIKATSDRVQIEWKI